MSFDCLGFSPPPLRSGTRTYSTEHTEPPHRTATRNRYGSQTRQASTTPTTGRDARSAADGDIAAVRDRLVREEVVGAPHVRASPPAAQPRHAALHPLHKGGPLKAWLWRRILLA